MPFTAWARFFRGGAFKDLDLVAVVDCARDELAQQAERIHSSFRELGAQLGLIIDLTIFTPAEFSSAPLRDMATLVQLYRRDVCPQPNRSD